MPTCLVFSDVDETLINRKSMIDFFVFYQRVRYGATAAKHAVAALRVLTERAAAGEPRACLNRGYYRLWAGEPADEVTRCGARWYAEQATREDFYLADTRAALLRHRAEGAVLVLVSGSFPAVLRPVADEIGARHLICVRPQAIAGVLTGDIVGEPIIGEAKRSAVRTVLRAYPDIDPVNCYAYGDHISDLPMLAEVGHPVVVGDSQELLSRLAATRLRPAAA